jgi:hypothetical protein
MSEEKRGDDAYEIQIAENLQVIGNVDYERTIPRDREQTLLVLTRCP